MVINPIVAVDIPTIKVGWVYPQHREFRPSPAHVIHRRFCKRLWQSSSGGTSHEWRTLEDFWEVHLFPWSHTIHGTGIFTYIYHKNQPNVGKYTSPMDVMGLGNKLWGVIWPGFCIEILPSTEDVDKTLYIHGIDWITKLVQDFCSNSRSSGDTSRKVLIFKTAKVQSAVQTELQCQSSRKSCKKKSRRVVYKCLLFFCWWFFQRIGIPWDSSPSSNPTISLRMLNV